MMSNNATPIINNPIVLDLTGCTGRGEVHQRIRRAFGFPDYYGENWDAMWDCLDELFGVNESRAIHIKGFHTLPDAVQEYCQPMRAIFDELQKECPNLLIIYL